jgi:hypothetical protein
MMSGLGGVVQRSLDDRRALMDSCRAEAPFGAIVALIDGWSGGGLRLIWSITLEMGSRKAVEVTFREHRTRRYL